MQGAEVSTEMKEFFKQKEECGGGAWCTLKAIGNNPSVVTQIMASSLVGMTSGEALAAGGTAAIAAAPTGLGSGIAGFAVAGGYTDAIISFSEFLGEEIGGGENVDWNNVTQDQVLNVLNDPEKLSRIRGRAAARGISIAVIDAITFGIASKTGRAVAKATKSKGLGAAAGLTTEAAGGSLGEAVAQVTAGQEIDTGEILLEGLAELGGPESIGVVRKSIRDVIGKKQADEATQADAVEQDAEEQLANIVDAPVKEQVPQYQLGDQFISKEDISAFIKGASPSDLVNANITINNDQEYADDIDNLIQRAKIDSQIDSSIPQGAERQQLISTEQELLSLKENDTESGKLRKKVLRDEIQRINAKHGNGVDKPNATRPASVAPRVREVKDEFKNEESWKGEVEPSTPSPTAETTKDGVQAKAKTQKPKQFLVLRDEETGELEALNEDGERASAGTEAKYVREHLANQPNTGVTAGEKIGDANIDETQYSEAVASESENPVEVAQTIEKVKLEDPKADVDPLEEFVLGQRVNRQSFIDNSDINNVTKTIQLKWFKKGGLPLDQVAIEASSILYGDYDANRPQVTEQDIVDIILNNPGKATLKADTGLLSDLKAKFKQLTGVNATPANIQAVLASQENVVEDATIEETAQPTGEQVQEFTAEEQEAADEELRSILEQNSEELAGLTDEEYEANRQDLIKELSDALGVEYTVDENDNALPWWEEDPNVATPPNAFEIAAAAASGS